MNKKEYEVTEKAGKMVACRRVKPGDILQLTDAEAEYEMREGTIRLVAVSKPSKEVSKAASNKE
jgi:hypothetical protein